MMDFRTDSGEAGARCCKCHEGERCPIAKTRHDTIGQGSIKWLNEIAARAILYFCYMKKQLFSAVLIASSLACAQVPDPLKFVDPLIGTGPEGHTFPGATAPFGMVQLSPDTQIRPFKQSYKWAAGYRYDDTTILGFSHTHFSGAGHSDLGDVLVMPVSGENVPLEPGDIGFPFTVAG